jgi:hypothetical protein
MGLFRFDLLVLAMEVASFGVKVLHPRTWRHADQLGTARRSRCDGLAARV